MAELGFDVSEDKRTFEKQGITGNVTNEVTEEVSYPYLMIVSTDEHKVTKNQLQLLPNLFAASNLIESDDSNSPISIYFKAGENVMKLGKINGRQVKAFVRSVGVDSITGMFDKNTKLVGDMIYVLSE